MTFSHKAWSLDMECDVSGTQFPNIWLILNQFLLRLKYARTFCTLCGNLFFHMSLIWPLMKQLVIIAGTEVARNDAWYPTYVTNVVKAPAQKHRRKVKLRNCWMSWFRLVIQTYAPKSRGPTQVPKCFNNQTRTSSFARLSCAKTFHAFLTVGNQHSQFFFSLFRLANDYVATCLWHCI